MVRVSTNRAQAGRAGHELDGLAETPMRSSPTRVALFGGFFLVGIFGFGGVPPMARRTIVEQRKWLSPGDFSDLLALSARPEHRQCFDGGGSCRQGSALSPPGW